MTIRKYLLTVLSAMALMPVSAQQTSKQKQFEDVEKYPEEVTELFSTVKVSKEDEAFTASFGEAWNNGTFTDEEKLKVVGFSNLLLAKKARNIQYYAFWRCMLAFKLPANANVGFNAWMEALMKLGSSRKNLPSSLGGLIAQTEALLTSRSLYVSPGNEWRLVGDNFSFAFERDTLRLDCSGVNLMCYSKGDSITIEGTSGRLTYIDHLWRGKGGTVTWERAGLAPTDVNATLADYTIDMTKSQYEAENVTLFHATYFPQSVKGKLTDRVRHNQSTETALYPEFQTYEKSYSFKDIFPGVSYEGGLVIQGARTAGSGTADKRAVVHIGKSDSLRMDVYSKSFMIRKDRINAYHADQVVHFEGDSITHDNLSFSYLAPSREASFISSDAATSQGPYTDSYHKIYMNFDQMLWKVGDTALYMSALRGSAVGRAQFRSLNYFNRNEYERLMYFDSGHPLYALKKFTDAIGQTSFTTEQYAEYLKRSVAETRSRIIDLAKLGYLSYDGESDHVEVLPMLYETIQAAAKQTDFDIIDLRSYVDSPTKNAYMNIDTRELKLNGIDRVAMSDSQQVALFPGNRSITMGANRSMTFDGHVTAGQTVLYGDSLHFDYNRFDISMKNADSLILYVPDTTENGYPFPHRLLNVVEGITGRIEIDNPENKSGRKSMPDYPILYSNETSKVTYGSSEIEGGAYANKDFYFELDPFVLSNLDRYSKEQLVLPGRFSSAEIFADMQQTLRVQPDFSLGFSFETEQGAIPAYNDAQMAASVTLDKKGLRASGNLTYLTTTIKASNFGMYPDSMTVAKATEIEMLKQTSGVEFPEIHTKGNRVHWEPKKDRMMIYKTEQPFSIYDKGRFDGNLRLSSKGLSGIGQMNLGNADLRSDSMALRSAAFNADKSLFRLKADNDGPYLFITADSVRSNIDMESQRGEFNAALRDYALVRFPQPKFEAYVDRFIWDMKGKTLSLGSDNLKEPSDFKYKTEGEGKGTRYVSTMYGADSLNFVAEKATFDYSVGELKAEGVNLLQSADALIYPNEGKLSVNPQGQVQLSDNARVVFNNVDKQHTVHSAMVSVTGRKNFSGSGIYDYVDEAERTTPLTVALTVDKNIHTTATADIADSMNFKMNSNFSFAGNMKLISTEKYPLFDGVTSVTEECETLNTESFRFSSLVNPADVQITITDAPVTKDNSKLYNGIFLSKDSIYGAFFSRRRSYSDKQLFRASGVLHYERDSMIYRIAPPAKLHNPDTTGNVLSLNRDRCMLVGEGRLSTGVDLGQVTLDAVGTIVHNLNNRETTLDIMLAVDFLFDNGLASLAAGSIDSLGALPGVDLRRTTFTRGLNEWMGIPKALKYRQQASLGSVKDFPDELKHTILFNQLHMVWDPDRASFRSTGKIGISNIAGKQINRLMDGHVEIFKRPGGDMLDIYLKMSETNWIYFGYTRELMQIISSDEEFNARLIKLPEKQRKSPERKPASYVYMICSTDKFAQFRSRLNRIGQSSAAPAPTPGEQPRSEAPREKSEEKAQPVEIE